MTMPAEITASNVATIFPDVDTSLARDILPSATSNGAAQSPDLDGYDDEQVRLMEEVCIVLDNEDRPIGSASKKTCKSSRADPVFSPPITNPPPSKISRSTRLGCDC